jgi:hypothetical protein
MGQAHLVYMLILLGILLGFSAFFSGSDNGGDVLARLASGKINQVPVIENGEIKEIVCRSNILDFLHLRSELGI